MFDGCNNEHPLLREAENIVRSYASTTSRKFTHLRYYALLGGSILLLMFFFVLSANTMAQAEELVGVPEEGAGLAEGVAESETPETSGPASGELVEPSQETAVYEAAPAETPASAEAPAPVVITEEPVAAEPEPAPETSGLLDSEPIVASAPEVPAEDPDVTGGDVAPEPVVPTPTAPTSVVPEPEPAEPHVPQETVTPAPVAPAPVAHAPAAPVAEPISTQPEEPTISEVPVSEAPVSEPEATDTSVPEPVATETPVAETTAAPEAVLEAVPPDELLPEQEVVQEGAYSAPDAEPYVESVAATVVPEPEGAAGTAPEPAYAPAVSTTPEPPEGRAVGAVSLSTDPPPAGPAVTSAAKTAKRRSLLPLPGAGEQPAAYTPGPVDVLLVPVPEEGAPSVEEAPREADEPGQTASVVLEDGDEASTSLAGVAPVLPANPAPAVPSAPASPVPAGGSSPASGSSSGGTGSGSGGHEQHVPDTLGILSSFSFALLRGRMFVSSPGGALAPKPISLTVSERPG